MLRASSRSRLLLFVAFASAWLLGAAPAVAQVLRQVHRFRQTGPDTVQAVGFQVTISYGMIFVGGPPPPSARLTGPGTTLELPVQGPMGDYLATRNYETEAAMRRDFPSGNYVLTLGGSSLSFSLDLSATVTPPRITTWSALQAWDGGPFEVSWTPVGQVLPGAGFGLSFSNSAGEAVYYPFGQNTAIGSIGRESELPAARRSRFNITSALENGLSIYGLSGPIDSVGGEWTGKLAVVAHGSRAADPGVFAVVPATGSSAGNGASLHHVVEAVVEFPVRRPALPPVIQTRPTDRTVRPGAQTGFFVSATGGGNLTFQWYRNGAAIPGATVMDHNISSAGPGDAGDYHAVVTNAFGSASTPVARLTVSETAVPPVTPPGDGYTISVTSGPPVITKQPRTMTVYSGETFQFAVGLSGEQPFTYQWYRNGDPAIGGNNPIYTVLPAMPQIAGRYKVTVTNPRGSVTSDEVELIVQAPPRITNLSVRAPVRGTEEALTIGFTISKPASNNQGGGTVFMLARGVGPSLQSFGVGDAVADPQLAIYTGDRLVMENDDWTGQANFAALMARVGAFPLGAASKDAALLPSLGVGSHSLRLSGAGEAVGVVLGEIYDTNDDGRFLVSSARFSNVSALARTGPGAEALSAGFVIAGAGTRTVLIRGVGPTLANVGVAAGFVANPRVTLYGSGGMALDANDDWNGTPVLREAFAKVGAFDLATDSRDAALVAVLSPGSYTVRVESGDGSRGLALVEIYEMP